MAKKNTLAAAEAALRKVALAYPEAVEEYPWGHSAMKVKRKVFLFMALSDQDLSLSVKLPESHMVALSLPFTSPTEYGLGKSGWVTATFAARDNIPVALLAMWIDESYRAIAPKALVSLLTDQPLDEKAAPRRGRRARLVP